MPRKYWLAVSLALILTFTRLANAQAHETREVAGGRYVLRVGFISEPPYQGLENGLELTVCLGACVTKDGTLTNGVAEAFDSLKAEVIFGTQNMPLTLAIVPRTVGQYRSNFVPTRVGDYTFHIFGTLGTNKIDEKFTSSPTTFDSVQALTVVQFPDKPGYSNQLPSAPVQTPANSATALPTQPVIAPTNSAELQTLKDRLSEQQKLTDTAKTEAANANTIAWIGIVIGVVGIALSLIILVINRFGNRPKREPERG